MEFTFDQHIGTFKNAVPPEVCEKIITLFEQNINKTIDRHTENNISGNPNPLPYGSREDRLTYLIDLDLDLDNTIKNFLLDKIIKTYAKKYFNIYEFKGFGIKDIKVQRTLPTEGYHTWHWEHSYFQTQVITRVLAYTIYLNDIEDGGETEFLHQSLRIKPTTGTLCLWPSYFTHLHRGNPPLSKAKYILTGWIETSLPEDLTPISPLKNTNE